MADPNGCSRCGEVTCPAKDNPRHVPHRIGGCRESCPACACESRPAVDWQAVARELVAALRKEAAVTEAAFTVGANVEKIGGDYTFAGIVVAAFPKLSGAVRYVVEDDRGVLHVYGDKNLRALEGKGGTNG